MKVEAHPLTEFHGRDLADLCDAAEAAIQDGNGFGWLKPPARTEFERYWRGAVLVPRREVFVARIDGRISGSAQLVRPAPNKEAWRYNVEMDTHFVAPYARGHGLARALVDAVEAVARTEAFKVMLLSVRATQEAAITLYEGLGYVRYGTNPRYAYVDRAWIAGHFYYKDL
ncbi:MAG: GNAT family N-acetyltransferase [Alphaproteobacteria bacterium]|nr:GNAT family N-acetyltransferase [Alphaproteobacteria bacterium]